MRKEKVTVDNGTKTGCAAISIWVLIAIGLMVLATLCEATNYALNRSFLFPQIRENMNEDPARSLARRQQYHTLLNDIITDDGSVIGDIKAIQSCSATTCTTSKTDTLETYLVGLEGLRSTNAGEYNALSDNPDNERDRDYWMPKHLDLAPIPADNDAATVFLTQEMATLSTYRKG